MKGERMSERRRENEQTREGRVTGEARGKSFMRHGKRGEKKREVELMPAVGLNRGTPCPL